MPMVKFEPTDEQREGVAHLASAGVLTLEEIAKQVVNPRTGRSISAKTLNRIFKQELAENTQLKKRVLEQYRAAVDRGESWAVKFGMEHLVGVSGKDKDKDGAAKPSRVENINVLFRGAPLPDEAPGPTIEHRPAETRPKLLPSWAEQDDALRAAITPKQSEVPSHPMTQMAPTELDIEDFWQQRRPKAKDLGRPFRGPNKWGPSKKKGWMG